VAKKIKSHRIAGSVILPACCTIVNVMLDEKYEKEILKILMSDNTISQHTESQVIASIKEASFSAIQLDKSTDITGKVQLLAFSRFICNGDITEQFLFCKPLQETKKCQHILDVVDSYFISHDLS
jgi:hypothetical protein